MIWLINHQDSHCLWGQGAHEPELAAVAMAGEGGGVSRKEQPLRGALVNWVMAHLEDPLEHLYLPTSFPLLKAESRHATDCKGEKLNLVQHLLPSYRKSKTTNPSRSLTKKKMKEWHKLHETPKGDGYCLCVRSRQTLKWTAPVKGWSQEAGSSSLLPFHWQPHPIPAVSCLAGAVWLQRGWMWGHHRPYFRSDLLHLWVYVYAAMIVLDCPKCWACLDKTKLFPPNSLQGMGSTDTTSWGHLFPCC